MGRGPPRQDAAPSPSKLVERFHHRPRQNLGWAAVVVPDPGNRRREIRRNRVGLARLVSLVQRPGRSEDGKNLRIEDLLVSAQVGASPGLPTVLPQRHKFLAGRA